MEPESAIITRPMQWNAVMDGFDVAPLSEADRDCLKDMRDVLAKHGRLDRFGVTLIHKHFAIADDECLVETIDPVRRTLTVRPKKKTSIGVAMETQWQLAMGEAYIVCDQQCVVDSDSHNNRHYQRPDN